MKIFVLLVAVVVCVQGQDLGTFFDILGDDPERWAAAERCMEELAGSFSDPPKNTERCKAVKHILECACDVLPKPINIGLRKYGRKEWGCNIPLRPPRNC